MVASPKVPVRAHLAPVTVVIALQRSQTILVVANTPVSAPDPALAAMQAVTVVISLPQIPISTHANPARAGPAFEDAQAVEVVADTAPSPPEPAKRLVVMVAFPQMPVRTYLAPAALVVAVADAKAVEVHVKVPVASPAPPRLAVELVVVVVASNEVPIAAHVVPARTVPAAQGAQAASSCARGPTLHQSIASSCASGKGGGQRSGTCPRTIEVPCSNVCGARGANMSAPLRYNVRRR